MKTEITNRDKDHVRSLINPLAYHVRFVIIVWLFCYFSFVTLLRMVSLYTVYIYGVHIGKKQATIFMIIHLNRFHTLYRSSTFKLYHVPRKGHVTPVLVMYLRNIRRRVFLVLMWNTKMLRNMLFVLSLAH